MHPALNASFLVTYLNPPPPLQGPQDVRKFKTEHAVRISGGGGIVRGAPARGNVIRAPMKEPEEEVAMPANEILERLTAIMQVIPVPLVWDQCLLLLCVGAWRVGDEQGATNVSSSC